MIKKNEEAFKTEESTEFNQPIYTLNHKLKGQFLSFKSQLKIELTGVFKSLSFMAILLVWIVLVVIQIYSWIDEGGIYNDSFYPTTDRFNDISNWYVNISIAIFRYNFNYIV